MKDLLTARSPLAVASRMLLSVAATLFLLTAVAVLVRPAGDGTEGEISVAGRLPPVQVNLAAVR